MDGRQTFLKGNQSLNPKFKVNFRDIRERATNFEYMHGISQMASHNVHVGSKAADI